MSGHVIRPLGSVPIEFVIFGRDAAEKIVQIGDDIGIGVLRTRERSRSVTNEYRQQPSGNTAGFDPALYLVSELVKTFSARRYLQRVRMLLHSTVTLLARLRGWSTSQPNRTATWYASSWSGTISRSGSSSSCVGGMVIT